MGQSHSHEPYIPLIARNVSFCVDPANRSSVDDCPGRSVCYPGNLPWIPRDSPHYNATGLGFCSCYSSHGASGDDCSDYTAGGVVQIVFSLLYILTAVYGFCATVIDGIVFVRRVRRAKLALRTRLLVKDSMSKAVTNPTVATSATATTDELKSRSPLSMWNWFANDPTFPLLICSGLCLFLITFLQFSHLLEALRPYSLGVYNSRYKTYTNQWFMSLAFAAHGVNNVSMMLLGVAWIKVAHRASHHRFPVSNASYRRQAIRSDGDATQSTPVMVFPRFLSRRQAQVLVCLEYALRLGLLIFPVSAIVLYLNGHAMVLYNLALCLTFFMCIVFLYGSLLARRLLQRAASYWGQSVRNRSDASSRKGALLRMHDLIRKVTFVVFIGNISIFLSGALLRIDLEVSALVRLPGRESPTNRVRIWVSYTSILGHLIVAYAMSWFARKITRGVSVDPSRACFTFCNPFESTARVGMSFNLLKQTANLFRSNYVEPPEDEDSPDPDDAIQTPPTVNRQYSFTILEINRPAQTGVSADQGTSSNPEFRVAVQ